MSLTLEQKAQRRLGIGASDSGPVAGLSPWKGELDVWLDKTGRAADSEDSEASRWGTRLEPALSDALQDLLGMKAQPFDRMSFQHPEHPWALASPDRELEDGSLAELKTAGYRQRERWEESPGLDVPASAEVVPAEYYAQGQWQMGVLGRKRNYLAVLIGGQEFRVYLLEFDPDFFADLLTINRRFWFEHVVADVQPASGSERAARAWLAARHPRNLTSDPVPPGPGVLQVLEELGAARAAFDVAKAAKAHAEFRVKEAIGDGAGFQWSGGKVTWLRNRDSKVTDWKGVAGELHPSDALVAEFTKVKEGSRVLRCRFEGEEDDDE